MGMRPTLGPDVVCVGSLRIIAPHMSVRYVYTAFDPLTRPRVKSSMKCSRLSGEESGIARRSPTAGNSHCLLLHRASPRRLGRPLLSTKERYQPYAFSANSLVSSWFLPVVVYHLLCCGVRLLRR